MFQVVIVTGIYETLITLGRSSQVEIFWYLRLIINNIVNNIPVLASALKYAVNQCTR